MDEKKSDGFGPPIVVGFEEEALKIMERLVGKQKSLDVISIVGMPGIGKTTLALKVYNHPYVAHHFYIQAWIPVSQVYEKRDLLLGILRSSHMINPTQCDVNKMSDEKLKEELYKRLKENRYLIFLDDIWDTEAWEYLKRSFPNDNNGSRIMFTTRIRDVAMRANSIPHDMRFLSPDESWDLLHEKVFDKETCPPELMEVGKKIAENCGGLPLAIVTIGGLLAKREKTKELWTQVGESIASYVVSDSNQATKSTLELSYNHLPAHLKPLFLYFGAFPEDYEIPVSQMIWLWIGEGFIKKSSAAGGAETVEDVAEGYLMDLIERSLILIANRNSIGGVKSCRIHDLLRDLCLRKAKEVSFMKIINRFERYSSTIPSSSTSTSFSSSSPIGNKFNRLSICDGNCFEIPFDCRSNLCSLLYFTSPDLISEFIPARSLRFLRVLYLNICGNFLAFVPRELGELVNLRYLALRVYSFPKSVFKLKKLQILILHNLASLFPKSECKLGKRKNMALGMHEMFNDDIFEMIKLRHLHIGRFYPPRCQSSKLLADLQSISTPIFLNNDYTLLLATPNLRKLRCFCDINPIHELGFLVKLEKLDMSRARHGRPMRLTNFLRFDLPASLKRITLSGFHFDWKEISKLARLPNLEVLKLVDKAFDGYLWDTSLLESNFQPFPKLKFFKLFFLNIREWNASTDHFPSLQRIVVKNCFDLMEIPSELGDIPTLKTIEVIESRHSVDCSARKILEEQRAKGNEQLEIFVKARRLKIQRTS